MRETLSLVLIGIALTLAACECADENFDPATITPQTLRDIIAEQQKKHIRVSFGEFRHECFTWEDYQRFVADRQPAKIAAELQKCSKRFQVVVALINELPKDEQQKLLNSCRRPLRPTWREMGRISHDGDGNTEAGNLGERKCADAIVDLVSELVGLKSDQ